MPRYSVIIPSAGRRPLALGQAIDSALAAAHAAKLDDVEILVGFDGVRGQRVRKDARIRWYDLPADHDFGNGPRQALLRAARGRRVVFLDDDNALLPQAFSVYEAHDVDMLVARIDVSRAFPLPFLPLAHADKALIRPGNIDPLCLCLTRKLVVTRCGGWLPRAPYAPQRDGGQYESDYRNILRYWRRAASTLAVDDVVGVYDAGRGMDAEGMNARQKALR